MSNSFDVIFTAILVRPLEGPLKRLKTGFVTVVVSGVVGVVWWQAVAGDA